MKHPKTTKQNPKYDESSEEDKSIIDYLHGDVEAEQAEIACYYEYGRKTDVLKALGLAHRAGVFSDRDSTITVWDIIEAHFPFPRPRPELVATVARLFPDPEEQPPLHVQKGIPDQRPLDFKWLWIFFSNYFPEQPWRSIPTEKRSLPRNKPDALPVINMRRFADLAEEANSVNKAAREAFEKLCRDSAQHVNLTHKGSPPAEFREKDVEGNENGQMIVAFHIDLNLGRAVLNEGFSKWLDRPENLSALEKARVAASKRDRRFISWLRDLAWFKLSQRFVRDVDRMRNFVKDRQKWDATGKPRRFYDEANGTKSARKTGDFLAGRVPSSILRAARRAEEHRATLFPFERVPAELAKRRKESSDEFMKLHFSFFENFKSI